MHLYNTRPTLFFVGENNSCCCYCLRSFRSPRSLKECPGSSPSFDRIFAGDFGHVLWAARITNGSLLVFCNRCGAFCENRAVYLCKPCGEPTSYSARFFRQLRRGLHPADSGGASAGLGDSTTASAMWACPHGMPAARPTRVWAGSLLSVTSLHMREFVGARGYCSLICLQPSTSRRPVLSARR